jgi:hypothetical protein
MSDPHTQPPNEVERRFGLVLLPPFAERTVVQMWQFTASPIVFRTLELVRDSFYMVARLLDESGTMVGGEQGFPLSRSSFNEYRQTAGVPVRYCISEVGDLLCYAPGDREPSMRFTPVDHRAFGLGA